MNPTARTFRTDAPRSRRTFLKTTLGVVAALALTVGVPTDASAQTVSGSVRVILASNGGTTSGSLNGLASRLTRQFPRFDTFTERGMQRLSLSPGQSQTISLPGNQTATIQLISVNGGQREFRISIPGGGTTVRTSGGLFFVGGPNVPGGTLILAIST